MEEVKTKRQFTREELEKIATNLSMQLQEARMKINEVNMNNIFRRLDYLYKTVELAATGLFTEEFITKCAKEIETIITIPEQSEDSAENSDKEVAKE